MYSAKKSVYYSVYIYQCIYVHNAVLDFVFTVSRTCTAPLDRLRSLSQAGKSESTDLTKQRGWLKPLWMKMSNDFRSMIDKGGVRSLWRGNGINLLRIAPEFGIRFACYENVSVISLQSIN